MSLTELMRQFAENPVPNLPLSLTHGFGYPINAPIAEKQRIIRAVLEDLRAKGFGGLVTNVCQAEYLKNDEEWFILRWLVQTCGEMGLRVWLYDEKGYPSGGAGGLTLEEGNPDWQAQGLAMKAVTFAPGEPVSIPFPKGHTCVYAAYAWKTDSLDALSEEALLSPWKTYDLTGQADLSDENTTDGPVTAAVFYRKPMYEGTHAIHNVCEARRYIDVSNKEAVAAFLENTYRPYVEKLAGAGRIEAIFTDEPSYMGAYINLGLFPQSTRDAFDETMEFLPSVNWGADVANRFASTWGYDLKSRVYCLFTGHGEEAMAVRQQFYSVLSDLYEQSFFAQISDFCAKHDLPFSGHVLLEDDIRYHPVFEGNFFSLLRHMHIPGIDMLHGLPERIRADAAEPKSNDDLRRLGIGRIMAAEKGRDSILHGIARLQEYRITISPGCPAAIAEFSSYAWEPGEDGKPSNKPADTNNHMIDALRYASEDFRFFHPVTPEEEEKRMRRAAAAERPMPGGWDI